MPPASDSTPLRRHTIAPPQTPDTHSQTPADPDAPNVLQRHSLQWHSILLRSCLLFHSLSPISPPKKFPQTPVFFLPHIYKVKQGAIESPVPSRSP